MVAARLVPVGALAVSVLTVVVPSSATGRPTTYAAASAGSAIADLTAGLALVLVGSVVAASGRHGSIGPLTALLGLAWLAPDWAGWDHGWAPARSVAAAATAFVPALLAHLVLVFPAGRTSGGRARVLLAVTYATTALPVLGLAMVRDPELDRYCWANCSANVFLINADIGLARTLTNAGHVLGVATGLAVTAWCGWRVTRSTPVARRVRAGVLIAAGGAAAAEAADHLLLLAEPAEDPTATRYVVVFLLRAALLAGLAGAVASFAVKAARVVARVGLLATRLGDAPPPGTLRAELARSLGDDRVDVAYWLPGLDHWADADGHAVDPEPGPSLATTVLMRGGRPVALVTHDAELRGLADLGSRIGAAARLAVDNERLRAQLLARLEEVRASRARLVAIGDAERRRLERDLHDGAQQRLLSVAYELRLAQAEADPGLAVRVESATAKTLGALTEMRELAQGIFPAILGDAGLRAALRTYAERAPTALAIEDVTPERYSAPVEVAAYAVVTSYVEDAAARGAGQATVSVTKANGGLVMQLSDDSADEPGRPSLDVVADRVAALGGRIAYDEVGIEVSIPCGSS